MVHMIPETLRYCGIEISHIKKSVSTSLLHIFIPITIHPLFFFSFPIFKPRAPSHPGVPKEASAHRPTQVSSLLRASFHAHKVSNLGTLWLLCLNPKGSKPRLYETTLKRYQIQVPLRQG